MRKVLVVLTFGMVCTTFAFLLWSLLGDPMFWHMLTSAWPLYMSILLFAAVFHGAFEWAMRRRLPSK